MTEIFGQVSEMENYLPPGSWITLGAAVGSFVLLAFLAVYQPTKISARARERVSSGETRYVSEAEYRTHLYLQAQSDMFTRQSAAMAAAGAMFRKSFWLFIPAVLFLSYVGDPGWNPWFNLLIILGIWGILVLVPLAVAYSLGYGDLSESKMTFDSRRQARSHLVGRWSSVVLMLGIPAAVLGAVAYFIERLVN